jgi:outer membrane protein OmpA-like peptidoglycan-associated protein
MKIGKQGLILFAAVCTVATPALAGDAKREGVIVSIAGDQLQVQTREGPLTVVVTPSTKIRETGFLSSKDRQHHNLIPGLIIKADGSESGGTFTAEDIQFKERDWRSAIASKAGTQQQFEQQAAHNQQAAAERAALRQAIIDGNEYVIKDEATVLFATGSAVIAEQYKQRLMKLAREVASHGNYRLSILGYADPRGDAAANERLSAKRALAVSNYLRQTGHVQPGRVLSPSAMGEGASAPGDAVPANNDEARRVVVRVVTPKSQLQ